MSTVVGTAIGGAIGSGAFIVAALAWRYAPRRRKPLAANHPC